MNGQERERKGTDTAVARGANKPSAAILTKGGAADGCADADEAERVEGFAPLCFADSRVLILGSFPSVKSRAEGFYYGNPRNRFWRTVCGFFNEAPPASIAEKKEFLRRRKIALWDSVTACRIHRSEDASIREADRADVASLLRGTQVETVLCNGKAAFAYLPKQFLPTHVRVECLPSTSPANPRFDERVWRAALESVFGVQS